MALDVNRGTFSWRQKANRRHAAELATLRQRMAADQENAVHIPEWMRTRTPASSRMRRGVYA